MIEFKNKLKLLRESKGWTQEELAKRLGVSRSKIGNYELGLREPGFEDLEAFADIFNCSISYLIENDRLGPDNWYTAKESYFLTLEEAGVINKYREMNVVGKKELERFTDYLMTRPDCRKESESGASSDAV